MTHSFGGFSAQVISYLELRNHPVDYIPLDSDTHQNILIEGSIKIQPTIPSASKQRRHFRQGNIHNLLGISEIR